jgi:hypothetical protein
MTFLDIFDPNGTIFLKKMSVSKSVKIPVNFSARMGGKFCQDLATLTSSQNCGRLPRCRPHVLLQVVLKID